MKVLVTGGAGYIGDAVVEYLLEKKCQVTVYDNLLYGGAYLRDHRLLDFVRGDIRDFTKVRGLVKEHDSVVHLAAIVGDAACAVRPEKTELVNEFATGEIATECMLHDRKMVFASTCSVYGANNDVLNEDSPTNPLSLYAGTKLNAEKHIREKIPNNHFIFRLGTLFGKSSEHARLRCDLVVNVLTYRAMQGDELSVFGGEQWRPLLHVKDAAEIMAQAAIEPTNQNRNYGTYILSYRNYSILEIANKVQKLTGKGSLKVTDAKFEDLRNYQVNNRKATLAGFIPQRHLDSGIIEMAHMVRQGRIANVWTDSYHNAKYIEALNARTNS